MYRHGQKIIISGWRGEYTKPIVGKIFYVSEDEIRYRVIEDCDGKLEEGFEDTIYLKKEYDNFKIYEYDKGILEALLL